MMHLSPVQCSTSMKQCEKALKEWETSKMMSSSWFEEYVRLLYTKSTCKHELFCQSAQLIRVVDSVLIHALLTVRVCTV